jgi:glycosyltransferase involved in cell wall biosynthesis
LPASNLKKRREVISKIPITFICPSSWIESQLRKSIIFNDKNHDTHVIHNSVDINTFKPLSKEEINKKKRDLNIKKEDFCIISGSFAQNEDRKGMTKLIEALRKVIIKNPNKKFRLLTFGKNKSDINFIETIDLGYLKNEVDMAKALNLGDLFVTMTKEDNLPNCIMESLSCGTPVISTKVGGVSEMIENDFNGKLVERNNTEEMSKEISNSFNKIKTWSVNSRNKAVENFSYEIQSKSYMEIFKNITTYHERDLNKEIFNTIKRFPAINTFPSDRFKVKAFDWYKTVYRKQK